MSSPKSRPDARTLLLEAARAELAERGPAAVGLRAIARRAGLSHAAPGYVFGDRAKMLTALATLGWRELASGLDRVDENPAGSRLARLGDAYVDFGLANAALYDLMFTRDVLDPDDVALQAAQGQAFAPLLTAAGSGSDASVDAVMGWALVHGLVTLARQGALPGAEPDVLPTVRGVTSRFGQLQTKHNDVRAQQS